MEVDIEQTFLRYDYSQGLYMAGAAVVERRLPVGDRRRATSTGVDDTPEGAVKAAISGALTVARLEWKI